MPGRPKVIDYGSYLLTRTWFGVWRWRLAPHLGGRHGLALTQAGARFAARQRLRAMRDARRRRRAITYYEALVERIRLRRAGR